MMRVLTGLALALLPTTVKSQGHWMGFPTPAPHMHQHNVPASRIQHKVLEPFTSNLPIVIIHTDDAINAEAKVRGRMQVVCHPEGKRNSTTDKTFDYDGFIGIKLRGNSSLSFEQKKYTVETQDAEGNDLKVPLLGMPAESDWVLLAPYNDISLLRDVFAFNLWREMDHWAPRTRLCEVCVNDEYAGVYVVSEKIKSWRPWSTASGSR